MQKGTAGEEILFESWAEEILIEKDNIRAH